MTTSTKRSRVLEEHFEDMPRTTSRSSSTFTSKTNFDLSTEQRPLSWQDQQRLRDAISRYQELHNHPLYPYKKPPARWSWRFAKRAGARLARRRCYPDLTPADVLRAIRRETRDLAAVRHQALGSATGARALPALPAEVAGERPAGDARCRGLQRPRGLVGRHLVLREADGSVSVHPAVRDYFALATSAEQGFWHHLIGDQLISLVRQPGRRLPTDQASLDLAEEAIAHAAGSGRAGQGMGPVCPRAGRPSPPGVEAGRDGARACGSSAASTPVRTDGRWGGISAHWASWKRVCAEHLPLFPRRHPPASGPVDAGRGGRRSRPDGDRRVPDGPDDPVPADPLGCVVPRRSSCSIRAGPAMAWLATEPEDVYEMIGWEDDRARCQLYRAEAACRMDDHGEHEPVARSGDRAGSCIPARSSTCAFITWSAPDRDAKPGFCGGDRMPWQKGCTWRCRCGLGLYHIELLNVVPSCRCESRRRPRRNRRCARPLGWLLPPNASFDGEPRRPGNCWGSAVGAGLSVGRGDGCD